MITTLNSSLERFTRFIAPAQYLFKEFYPLHARALLLVSLAAIFSSALNASAYLGLTPLINHAIYSSTSLVYGPIVLAATPLTIAGALAIVLLLVVGSLHLNFIVYNMALEIMRKTVAEASVRGVVALHKHPGSPNLLGAIPGSRYFSGSRYFCESLFWASSPSKQQNLTRPFMPTAPRPSCVRCVITSSRLYTTPSVTLRQHKAAAASSSSSARALNYEYADGVDYRGLTAFASLSMAVSVRKFVLGIKPKQTAKLNATVYAYGAPTVLRSLRNHLFAALHNSLSDSTPT
ncbi:hypothetical protein [Candidatus Reidiella endopervernicosa]|uniref:Uncharacterized protein n=1 Tax=Candidatus Reidiella endopervernicosa TaxID=2738883 RepID=A0A6N0HUU3_9GAMM|nr:hypothetical protein [Candidatus Reidiella endopervernicosa]QKQ26139.1 hypothetical protein HUE57_07460 [Candidatus Reidiella endopervernicosa]